MLGISNTAASVLTSWITLSGGSQLPRCKAIQVAPWRDPADSNRGPCPVTSQICQTCKWITLKVEPPSWILASDNYSSNVGKGLLELLVYIFFNIYLFIWLHRVLVAAGGFLSCGMRTLSCGMHEGSSSLASDRTQTPILEAQSLNHCITKEAPSCQYIAGNE